MIKSINAKKKIVALTCLIAAVVLIYIKSTSNKLIQIQLECVATMKQSNDDSEVRLTPIAPKTPRWNE